MFLFLYKIFFLYVKELHIYISKDSSAKYYQENKERVQKMERKKYKDLSEEEKYKKWEYGCKQYKNLPEYEK